MSDSGSRKISGGAGFVIILLLAITLIGLWSHKDDWGRPSLVFEFPTVMGFLSGMAVGVIAGLIIITLRYLFSRHALWTLFGLGVLLVFIGDIIPVTRAYQGLTIPGGWIVGGLTGLSLIALMMIYIEPATKLPNVFGSSRWANLVDLREWKLLGKQEEANGLFLGHTISNRGAREEAIIYEGDMHALTIAPTRTGKGATAIIPNLLRSNSSILIIDPKGENARRSAAKRKEMGQKVYVVDPWAISLEEDTYGEGIDPDYIAHFNPLDMLDPLDPDLSSDAMLLADALIISSDKDPFWSEEAKALIQGFILYVVTEEQEAHNKHLGRVRDILSLPAAEPDDDDLSNTLDEILMNMAGSIYPIVRQAAFRFRQKAEKERSGVLSTAQSNTHFLDSPKVKESLSKSDFRFKDLKTDEQGISVYLTLPLDRLPTFNRWLRLLISSAMIDLTREKAAPNKQPVRVILDEFPALQKLNIIETAYGTMAGLGVQLWVFTQDLGQLKKLYGRDSWSTFAANSGVIQYFGSRDYETAKYAEHLCGMTTMKKRSFSFGSSSSSTSGPQGGSSTSGTSETTSYDDISRPLAYADEMMTLHRDKQVLFIENKYPIIAKKWWWFL
ncbi:type IV secretory system conjugative DNA transfer family protein [Kordiimonas laminariae]|uniref:type IV secretory system conjugative DNA transfer family protein n=1 Tax=Kordiimonas laminariae TaxID=2917717 RepID=UPI001FF4D35E|nr:type IV secretory system conjugative DNA transfer family protein [Kordiimonas laminariae]MCK0070724.1 type IV secretory system conjugative DNA transfer family protein [Kordiimonas laminariae]